MSIAVLALAGFVGSGCADEELSPAASPVTEAPELSVNREKHKTADPPPPIRETRLIVAQPPVAVIQAQSSQITAAPVSTVTPPGTVNPLERAPNQH
jgi:hypothetical protein